MLQQRESHKHDSEKYRQGRIKEYLWCYFTYIKLENRQNYSFRDVASKTIKKSRKQLS